MLSEAVDGKKVVHGIAGGILAVEDMGKGFPFFTAFCLGKLLLRYAEKISLTFNRS